MKEITVKTKANYDVINITSFAEEYRQKFSFSTGSVLLFVKGSTAALTTMEFEEGVVKDFRNALELIAPQNGGYIHHQKWGDGNGFSHVRAAFLKPSLMIPFDQKGLKLGTWQQIVLINLDNRSRQRSVFMQVFRETDV